MMNDFLLRAAEEPAITFGASAIGGAVIGTLAFFFHRAVNRGDRQKESETKRIDALREFVGQQKKENEAIWRNVDELKKNYEKLHDRVYESKK